MFVCFASLADCFDLSCGQDLIFLEWGVREGEGWVMSNPGQLYMCLVRLSVKLRKFGPSCR